MRKCRWLCRSCVAVPSGPVLGRMNYLLGLLLFGAGSMLLRRWVRIVRRNTAVLNGWRLPRGGASVALLVSLSLAGWSAAEARAESDPALDPAQDLSDRTWPEAFDATIDLLKVRYPIAEHKGIDWEQVRVRYRKAFEDAETSGDLTEAYLAWRRFITETLRDGHVAFLVDSSQKDGELGLVAQETAMLRLLGGYFGLEIARCDDGSVLVVQVDDALAAAGLVWGSRIHEWNGRAIEEVLAETDLIVAPMTATVDARRLLQERVIVRAPVGRTAVVGYTAPGGEARHASITLTARAAVAEEIFPNLAYSRYCSVAGSSMWPTGTVRPDGIGVLRLQSMVPDLPTDPTMEEVLELGMAFVNEARKAVSTMAAQGVRGIVMDLRNNSGGLDQLGALIAGDFFRERKHYMTAVGYDAATRRWVVSPSAPPLENPVIVRPSGEPFGGRVVILANPETVSAGEGMARCMGMIPNSVSVGFFGTNGSFCNTGGQVTLKAGFTLLFPIERCVDEQGRILIDADASGRGGVVPEVRVPRTPETLHALYVDGRDPEMDAALALLQQPGEIDKSIPVVMPARVDTVAGGTFMLTAPAGGVSYQWFEGERGDVSHPVPGATAATLSLGATVTTSYWVRIQRSVGALDSATVPVVVPGSELELLAPTGTYGVGTVSMPLVDPTRSDVYKDGSTTAPRRVMLRIWYPAVTSPEAPRCEYMDAATFAFSAEEVEPAPDPELRELIATHAVESAPMPAGQGRFPVIVFAPGGETTYFGYQTLIEDLASRGYVVVAVNSPGNAGITVFPDGEESKYEVPANADETHHATHARVYADDLCFVIRSLAWLDRDRTLPFSGRTQYTRVGCVGHSRGGAAAFWAAVESPQVVAAANIDGSFWGTDHQRPVLKPMLMIRAAASAAEGSDGSFEDCFRNLRKGGCRILIPNAEHNSFCDESYLLAKLAVLEGGDAASVDEAAFAQSATRAALLGFFGPILSGPKEPGVVEKLATYPGVQIEQRTVRTTSAR